MGSEMCIRDRPTTATAQHSTHPKNNITQYATWRPTRTTSFHSFQTAAAAIDSTLIGPEHLSPSSRKRLTRQHERKREMEKEKNDAALARIFDDPSFPFFAIGCTNSLPALLRAWNRTARSSATRRRWTCVFLHDFLYTIPPFKNVTSVYLRVDWSCVTGTRS